MSKSIRTEIEKKDRSKNLLLTIELGNRIINQSNRRVIIDWRESVINWCCCYQFFFDPAFSNDFYPKNYEIFAWSGSICGIIVMGLVQIFNQRFCSWINLPTTRQHIFYVLFLLIVVSKTSSLILMLCFVCFSVIYTSTLSTMKFFSHKKLDETKLFIQSSWDFILAMQSKSL